MPRPRTSHLTLLRSDWSGPFPPGTHFPPRLPKDQLDFKRIGFILLHPQEDGPIREQQEKAEDGPIGEQQQEEAEDGQIGEQQQEDAEDGPIREQQEEAEDGLIREQHEEAEDRSIREQEGEEEEEESDVVLALSESSLSDSPPSNKEPEHKLTDSISHSAPGHRTESEVRQGQNEAVVGAKNVCVLSNGRRVVVWTR